MGIIYKDILLSLVTILHLTHKLFFYKDVSSGKTITRYMKSGPDTSTPNVTKSLRSNSSPEGYNQQKEYKYL